MAKQFKNLREERLARKKEKQREYQKRYREKRKAEAKNKKYYRYVLTIADTGEVLLDTMDAHKVALSMQEMLRCYKNIQHSDGTILEIFDEDVNGEKLKIYVLTDTNNDEVMLDTDDAHDVALSFECFLKENAETDLYIYDVDIKGEKLMTLNNISLDGGL